MTGANIAATLPSHRDPLKLSAATSDQIRFLRVASIFFMVYVHVKPGFLGGDWERDTAIYYVGVMFVDILGRASVAALSLVSGYLLWFSLRHRSPLKALVSRVRGVLVPMATANMLFILFAWAGMLFFNHVTNNIEAFVTAPTPMNLVNALLGVTSPTINTTLFFIRDLFVASCLCILFAAPIVARPRTIIFLITVLTVTDTTSPVIFRPTILLFMVTGFSVASLGITTRYAIRFLPLGITLLLLAIAIEFGGIKFSHSYLINGWDILKRTGLVILFVSAAVQIFPEGKDCPWLAATVRHCESRIFIYYLYHAPLFSVMWVGWQWTTGGSYLASDYLVFFLCCPIVTYLFVYFGSRVIDTFPVWAQSLVRGPTRGS